MDNALFMEQLNHPNREIRLNALEMLVKSRALIPRSGPPIDVNNHIHTWYSFSPYSPAMAVMMAVKAGLATAGIMDHDSVAGVREFLQAGKIAGFPVTAGLELRVSMRKTCITGRRINNPDQNDVAYMAIHGIPHNRLDEVEEFCKPILLHREIRNRHMIDRINRLTQRYIGRMDYDMDVLPLSKRQEGGSVTERHLLFALAGKIMSVYGNGQKTAGFLTETLGIKVSEKNLAYLKDSHNPYYQYDLLGALKSGMVQKFYIPAYEECPDVGDVIAFVNRIGAVSAYAYLGDVGNSVTGDKKTQKFEDDYLDELFAELKRLGFHAITYMPSRNTVAQLQRVKRLCETFGFMEISGEDINSPRQNFVCEALRDERFQNLITSTYALIEHERLATQDKGLSLFSPETVSKNPDLKQRIGTYAEGFLNRKT